MLLKVGFLLKIGLLTVLLVFAGSSPASAHAQLGAGVAYPPLFTGPPRVITRQQWGARPVACSFNSGELPPLQKVVVHHTETHDYDYADDAMMWLRSIQTHHIDNNGWCDIGYNFIVDKFGNIYEGVQGSFDRLVQGAHATGFNDGSLGIAMLGNYSHTDPSPEMLAAVGQIIGWTLGHAGVEPEGTFSFTGRPGQALFATGVRHTLPTVVGHRDVGSTTCPGGRAYAELPQIRMLAQGAADQLRAAGAFGDGVYGGFQETHVMHLAPTAQPAPGHAALQGAEWLGSVRVILVILSSIALLIAVADLIRGANQRRAATISGHDEPTERQL